MSWSFAATANETSWSGAVIANINYVLKLIIFCWKFNLLWNFYAIEIFDYSRSVLLADDILTAYFWYDIKYWGELNIFFQAFLTGTGSYIILDTVGFSFEERKDMAVSWEHDFSCREERKSCQLHRKWHETNWRNCRKNTRRTQKTSGWIKEDGKLERLASAWLQPPTHHLKGAHFNFPCILLILRALNFLRLNGQKCSRDF